MQRIVYERSQVDGFRTPRCESIALSNAPITGGQQQILLLFAGTTEGQLALYECRPTESSKF
jgi:hypothetical protein